MNHRQRVLLATGAVGVLALAVGVAMAYRRVVAVTVAPVGTIPDGYKVPNVGDVHRKYSDLELLDPTFRADLDRVLSDLRALGYDPYITETLRSQERQVYLYQLGRSKTPDSSFHAKGWAADVVDGRRDSNGDRVLWGASTNKGNDAERERMASEFFDALWAAVSRHPGVRTIGSWDKAHVQASA